MDFVVVGIGVEPNVELAVGCCRCRKRHQGRRALPDIRSRYPRGWRLRVLPWRHKDELGVGNAIDQAEAAAMTIVGGASSTRNRGSGPISST